MRLRKSTVFLIAMGLGSAANADTGNLVSDAITSGTTATDGTWSYGYTTSLGSSINLMNVLSVVADDTGNLYSWTSSTVSDSGTPLAGVNDSGSSYSSIPNGWAYLHPGTGGTGFVLSEFQYTASAAGNYNISVNLASGDGSTSRGVMGYVGTEAAGSQSFNSLYSIAVNSPIGDVSNYTGVVGLTAGETVDIVTQATNLSAGGIDNLTLVQGSITPVPLPAGAWLMLGGLGGLGAVVRKKRAS